MTIGYLIYEKGSNDPGLCFKASEDVIPLQVMDGDWVPTLDEMVKLKAAVMEAFPDREVMVIAPPHMIDIRREESRRSGLTPSSSSGGESIPSC